MPNRSPEEQHAINEGKLALTRLMCSPDGDNVRAWLRSFTETVLGPTATEAQLRHANGERALAHKISNLEVTPEPKKEKDDVD